MSISFNSAAAQAQSTGLLRSKIILAIMVALLSGETLAADPLPSVRFSELSWVPASPHQETINIGGLPFPTSETAETLARLVKAGKIRAIGVSNYSTEQMDLFRQAAPIHTVQPPYNLFERAAESDIIPYAKKHGIAVLAYGPLCRGLLTGRITAATTFEGDDLRNTDPKFQKPRLEQYLAAVVELDQLARRRYGKTVLALAVRWVLDRGDAIALWGARRPEQLAPVADVLGWSIDSGTMEAIDLILEQAIRDPVGPEFMAPPMRAPARRSAQRRPAQQTV